MVMDKHAMSKILGCLMKDPGLLTKGEFALSVDDFIHKDYKMLYSAIYNLFILGSTKISPSDVEGYMYQQPATMALYKDHNLHEVIFTAYDVSDMENFSYYYYILKRHALLNELNKQGINITNLYDPTLAAKDFENQMSKLNAMSIKDIINTYESKLVKIADRYENFIEKSCINAGDGIEELLASFAEQPEVGLPMQGDIMNTISRGARKKKLYIDSGAQGTGKSRRMVGNAAYLGVPQYYDLEAERWLTTNLEEKVLLITTELEHEEVQTILLANISGVNEAKILDGSYENKAESDRVKYAGELLKQYPNILIEQMPDPNIENVASKIKLHVLQNDVEYVFFDYIHVSGSTYTSGKEMRDDVWLMLFADRLKQLSNELNIHISTATQLSSDWEDKPVKNQNLIRGSKAIADKADIGAITLPVSTEAEKELAKAWAQKNSTRVPNFITDVYKNRRGSMSGVRLWRYIDLGTARVTDCFITDHSGEMIDFKGTMIKVQQVIASGGFAIFDEESGDVINISKEAKPDEF